MYTSLFGAYCESWAAIPVRNIITMFYWLSSFLISVLTNGQMGGPGVSAISVLPSGQEGSRSRERKQTNNENKKNMPCWLLLNERFHVVHVSAFTALPDSVFYHNVVWQVEKKKSFFIQELSALTIACTANFRSYACCTTHTPRHGPDEYRTLRSL